MMVADSSYLIEGILRDASLLEVDTFLAPDLASCEILNTIWKHEVLIGDLDDSSVLIDLFLELVSAETIQLVRPDERLIRHSYELSAKYKASVYDTMFVALVLELGSQLKTFDEHQKDILSKEENSRE